MTDRIETTKDGQVYFTSPDLVDSQRPAWSIDGSRMLRGFLPRELVEAMDAAVASGYLVAVNKVHVRKASLVDGTTEHFLSIRLPGEVSPVSVSCHLSSTNYFGIVTPTIGAAVVIHRCFEMLRGGEGQQ